jgi:hypothetical protein
MSGSPLKSTVTISTNGPANKSELKSNENVRLSEFRYREVRRPCIGIPGSLAEAYLNPKPPELHNTDGDRLEPRTLYFDIDSSQIAFDALASLAVGTTPDELLEDGKFDRSGSLVEATIPWIKPTEGNRVGLKTVLMGRIRIENRKLTVEVNSVARAKAVRARIEQSLGERARYRRSRKQSMESVVPPMTGGPVFFLAASSVMLLSESATAADTPAVKMAKLGAQMAGHNYTTYANCHAKPEQLEAFKVKSKSRFAAVGGDFDSLFASGQAEGAAYWVKAAAGLGGEDKMRASVCPNALQSLQQSLARK